MIIPNKIQLTLSPRNCGLYESFYFRGNSKDGEHGFWLKHNLLRFNNDRFVTIECSLILFDKANNKTKVLKATEKLTDYEYSRDPGLRNRDWDNLSFRFQNGSNFSISREAVSGKIISDPEQIQWNLNLQRSDNVYHHFSNNWFYTGFFPKKKILTRDTSITFRGTIKSTNHPVIPTVSRHPDESRDPRIPAFAGMTSSFYGINGHNWGKEHAYKYAYANCNQFLNDHEAYFDALSAKIVFLKGVIKSPYLSLASLRVNDRWYNFNSVATSFRHKVKRLSLKDWTAEFKNKDYILRVTIDGNEPQIPWVSLNYPHPSRKISTVNNTKFAKGSLTLIKRKTGEETAKLFSEYFELETLLP